MASTDVSAAPATGKDRLDPAVLRVAGVVVLGTLMSVLDMTVVNIALQNLTLRFATSFDTIQWVVTGYSLALAMVVPITGWAATRFGTKRLYLMAIVAFVLGSVLSGLAWNVESLIAFRVLQGMGGGVLMPAGMTIVTTAAGPQRLGRVMSILGVPLLLGPICGPILGGWLVDVSSWRWIFFINVPIGIVALLFASRVLPKDTSHTGNRFDYVGMLMLSPGLALLIFGVSRIPSAGGVGDVSVWLPSLVGLVCIVGFLLRAGRVANPLLDLKLFRNRAFTIGVLTSTFFTIAFFGSGLLFPTYFLLVRGNNVLQAGLLLAPNGIGAMLTMPFAGRLTDRLGARAVVFPGLLVIAAGTVVYTMIGANTPYWELLTALFVMGLGMGATMMPITAAAMVTMRPQQIPSAVAVMTVVQRIAGAIGSALMATVLAATLAEEFNVPTNQGLLTATAALHGPNAPHAASLAASSFATTFTWGMVLMIICLVPALFLPARRPQTRS